MGASFDPLTLTLGESDKPEKISKVKNLIFGKNQKYFKSLFSDPP